MIKRVCVTIIIIGKEGERERERVTHIKYQPLHVNVDTYAIAQCPIIALASFRLSVIGFKDARG
jgi:hypothetical protein